LLRQASRLLNVMAEEVIAEVVTAEERMVADGMAEALRDIIAPMAAATVEATVMALHPATTIMEAMPVTDLMEGTAIPAIMDTGDITVITTTTTTDGSRLARAFLGSCSAR
jgi:hypothetical protein